MAIVSSIDLGCTERCVSVDHDPTAVATDVPKGSIITECSTGYRFEKLDDGSTTNVRRIPKTVVTVSFVVSNDGAVIPTGIKNPPLRIAEGGTIVAWTLLANEAGSIVIDVWKKSLASGYPPTAADTITAAAKPTLTADSNERSTTLTGWTTAVAVGDVFRINVDSCTTIKQVTLILEIERKANG